MKSTAAISWVVFIVSAVGLVGLHYVYADESPVLLRAAAVEDESVSAEINALNTQITNKRSVVDEIRKDIAAYRQRIQEKQREAISLTNELELLGNHIAQTELELQAIQEEREAVRSEVQVLDLRIQVLDKRLTQEKESLAAILTKLDTYDNDFTLQLLFGNNSFAELFDRLEMLNQMTGDLEEALLRAKSEKQQVTLARSEKDAKKQQLATLAANTEQAQKDLSHQTEAKNVLLAESQQSEAEFRELLQELREEDAEISQQIGLLQGKIERRLLDSDTEVGSSVLSWAVEPVRGISAFFHDPTYPFRHLFEHSGIDVPVKYGTPLRVAAPGYVAWTRTGRQYGNYIMVIHANGIATIYAHLSKMSVEADQFVARGEVIGATGGTPGTPGAGFSTGAHLHFEVRKDGVPVNPLDYLTER